MSRFADEYLSRRVVGYPVQVGPAFSTQLVQVDSGSEQANQRWANPLRTISIPDGVRDIDTFEDLKDHFFVMAGPARVWPWRDPSDFASCRLTRINEVPALTAIDTHIALGDGITTDFQLVKRYTVGSLTYDRPIYLPIVSTVLVALDGVDTSGSPAVPWTISRPGGVLSFDTAPADGVVITAGYLFDLIVRYESDDTFKGIMKTFGVSGFADIPLQEVRYCED